MLVPAFVQWPAFWDWGFWTLEREEDGPEGTGKVLPNLRLELFTPLGQSSYQLAELIVIGAAGTCYPRSG